jgi:trimethylamine--corrinoid protein Co-methyltransferase
MVTGALNLFSAADLDRLHDAVLHILADTGLRVYGDDYLDCLVRAGATVSGQDGIVRFPAHMVEDFVTARRVNPCPTPRERGEPARVEQIGLSGVIAPFYYDYDRKARVVARREHLLDIIHWAEVDLSPERPVGLAVTMSEEDPRVEPIEAYALLLQHSRRPDTAYTLEPNQIPFLLELSEVYTGRRIFPRGTDFMTSPLTFTERLAGHVREAIRFGQREFNVGIMPISGSNAPMTLAGTVALGAAEALGGALTIQALAPEATFRFAACNGTTDFRQALALFNAPEALLTDLGTADLFERCYGGGFSVAAHADYIDAALPGLQAAYERTYRAMAIAAFTGDHFRLGGQGTLDAGQMFSPVQLILERDLSGALWRLGQGIAVNAETLALDAIHDVGPGDAGSYLDQPHTVRHCREMWFPGLIHRGAYSDDVTEHHRDTDMLDAANQRYKAAISRYSPIEVSAEQRRETEKILSRARATLLN